MKQLIDELQAIPGVVGACIYSSQFGLQDTNLPGIFRQERLTAVGKSLSRLCSAGRMSFADMTDVSLHYDESVVVARELQEDKLIFAICDPSFNHNLLTMSLNLLQEEYCSGRFSVTAEPPPVTRASEEKALVVIEEPPARAQDGTLTELLGVMKTRLAKVLGPMAGLIFEEVVEDWQARGAGHSDGLPTLLDLINEEIGDEDKIESYQQLIAPDLRGFQGG